MGGKVFLLINVRANSSSDGSNLHIHTFTVTPNQGFSDKKITNLRSY